MHVLRDAESINAEIQSSPDPHLRRLLTMRLEFVSEIDDYEVGELINFIVVEPGDTLQMIDAELDGTFLIDHWGGKRFGDSGFLPCFESLTEHATFYEMEFIQGDEGFAVEVLIPKIAGIDLWLLSLCAEHAKPIKEAQP